MRPSRKRNAAGAEAVDVVVTVAEAAVVAAAVVEVVVVTAAIAAIAGNVASPPTSSCGVIYFAVASFCVLLSRRFLHAEFSRRTLLCHPQQITT